MQRYGNYWKEVTKEENSLVLLPLSHLIFMLNEIKVIQKKSNTRVQFLLKFIKSIKLTITLKIYHFLC